MGVAVLLAISMQFAPIGSSMINAAQAEGYAKPKRAFEDGIRRYRAGDLGGAIKALEYATDRQHFRAKYYLARIYATNSNPYTDHGRSFQLYQEIVDEFAQIDPLYNLRAPYVARAIVELARYLKSGVPSVDKAPDYQRAASYLDHAAKYFGDREAQYELAKMYLTGDGLEAKPKVGKHWISTLAREGHAEAQAYLGDLFWRGKHVKQNKIQGMAYIMLALDNAQSHNRIWIEELYQHVYCQSSGQQRQSSALVAANLKKTQVLRKAPNQLGPNFGMGEFKTNRQCRNGEPVVMPVFPQSNNQVPLVPNKPIIQAQPSGEKPYYGAVSGGFGLRNVGSSRNGR